MYVYIVTFVCSLCKMFIASSSKKKKISYKFVTCKCNKYTSIHNCICLCINLYIYVCVLYSAVVFSYQTIYNIHYIKIHI